MTTRTRSQPGFTLIEIVIVLIVLVVIGALGYTFYNRMIKQSPQTSTQSTASDVPSAPHIRQTSDLDKATAALDQTDPSASSDAGQLDTMTSGF